MAKQVTIHSEPWHYHIVPTSDPLGKLACCHQYQKLTFLPNHNRYVFELLRIRLEDEFQIKNDALNSLKSNR